MKIVLASDHAGFSFKEELKKYLIKQKHEITDVGCSSDASCDYSDYGKKGALLISEGKVERGVFVCGSGIGICIAANRVKGVRAAVLKDEFDAEMSRKHNDLNVACIGGRITKIDKAKKLVDIFLTTEFEGGRHKARVEKLDR